MRLGFETSLTKNVVIVVGPAVPRATSEDGVVHTSETPGGQPESSIA
jgi:hypothetical protein